MNGVPSLEFRLPWSVKFEDSPLEHAALVQAGASHDLVLGRTRDDVQGQATFIGKVAEPDQFDKRLWLDLEGAHAIYIMGKRRGGKSHTLGVICEGLASDSWMTMHNPRQAVLVFDTMNVFLTMPRRRSPHGHDSDEGWELPDALPSVKLYRPGGSQSITGFDVPELHLGAHDLTAEEWIHTFGVDQYGDVLGHLLYDAYERVKEAGYSTNTGSVPASPRFGLAQLIACIDNATELQGFRDETKQAAIRRFRALTQNSIFDATGLDLQALLKPGAVSVLLLRDLPTETRELFVAVLVRRIMEARSSNEHYERLLRVAAPDDAQHNVWVEALKGGIPRTWLVLDEAHNYIPAGRGAISKRPLKRLIDEGRNIGLTVVVATQQPSGLDSSIQRNSDLLFIHSMTMEDDVRTAQGMLNTLWPKKTAIMRGSGRRNSDFYDAVRSLPRGYALVSSDVLPRIVAAKIRPRLTESGGHGY